MNDAGGRGSAAWHWTTDLSTPIWFCVRALVHDGLTVPPFDRHGGGDGCLRELGFDEATWSSWLEAVLAQHRSMSQLAAGPQDPDARRRLTEAAEVLRVPGSFCPGGVALQERLNQLFSDYAAAGEAWRIRMSREGHLRGSARQQRELWKKLEAFHDRLSTIDIFLVEYLEPATLTWPSTAALIAPASDADGFAKQVVAAAARLASGLTPVV